MLRPAGANSAHRATNVVLWRICGFGADRVGRRWLAANPAAGAEVAAGKESEQPPKKEKVKSPQPLSPQAIAAMQIKQSQQEEGEWHTITGKDIPLINVSPPEVVPIARLHHDLDRVLFEPGVHTLRNPNNNQFNFDPYLHKIPSPNKIDMARLHSFTPPSKDSSLVKLTKQSKQRYAGSTSSLGPTLAHLYFLVSRFRGVTPRNVSHAFQKESRNFTQASRQPAITTITDAGGVHVVDATKLESNYNVLSDLGTLLEKVFTSPKGALDAYLHHEHADHVQSVGGDAMPAHPAVTAGTVPATPESKPDSDEPRKGEAYRFSKVGDILVRSQLDCFHPNLARKVFDLKTRATVAVRLDVSNYKDYIGYKLTRYRGLFSSYEREYYDMIRSAFLKYSFQVRLGRMDGIMVAYHNTDEIFGFQYIPLSEMDICVFGNSIMGRAAFSLSTQLLNILLNQVAKVPSTTPRGMLVHTNMRLKVMDIYVVANAPSVADFFNDIDGQYVVSTPGIISWYKDDVRLYKFRMSTRSKVNGDETQTPYVEKPTDVWELSYNLREVDVASPFRQEHLKTELKQFIAKLTKRSPLAEGYKKLIRGHFVPPKEGEEQPAAPVDVSKPFEGPSLTKSVRRFRPFYRDRRGVPRKMSATMAGGDKAPDQPHPQHQHRLTVPKTHGAAPKTDGKNHQAEKTAPADKAASAKQAANKKA